MMKPAGPFLTAQIATTSCATPVATASTAAATTAATIARTTSLACSGAFVRSTALVATFALALALGCAPKQQVESRVTGEPRGTPDALADLGWNQLLDNRLDLAAETFKTALAADPAHDRAARGRLISQVLLGDDDRVLGGLNRLASTRLRASPENYLLRPVLCHLSTVVMANTDVWTAYLENLARDPSLTLGELRRIRRSIMLNYINEGEAGKVRDLAHQLNYVLEWSFLGPFDNAAGSGHGKLAVSPQAPVAAKTFEGKSGISFKWSRPSREYVPIDGTFGLGNYFPMSTNATGYAIATLTVPRATDCVISISHDGAIAVYLNGRLLYEYDHYGERGEQVHIRTHLAAGANQLFVEVSGLDAGASFAIGVSGPDGQSISGLVASGNLTRTATVPDSLQDAAMLEMPFIAGCRQAYEDNPQDPEAAFWYLISLLELADEEEIRPALRHMGDNHTHVALVQLARALLFDQIDERERMRGAWKRAAALAPACVPAGAFVISEHIDQGRYAAAQELLDKLKPRTRQLAELDLLELNLASLRGRKAAVKKKASDLALVYPELSTPYLHLMKYYADLGEMGKHECYRKAWLRSMPTSLALRGCDAITVST